MTERVKRYQPREILAGDRLVTPHFNESPTGEYVLASDFDALQQRCDRLRGVLEDFVEHGLRADLNPTHDLRKPEEFWHSYIRQIEESVRQRAEAALATGQEPRKD